MNQPCPSKRPALARLWLVTWLVIATGLLGRSLWHPAAGPEIVASRAPALTTTPPAEFRRTFKAIEDLRVGDRVLADNPDEASPDQTAIDPATWRLLTLFAEDRWPDGTHDTIHIQTLQPPAWVELFAAGVGAEVPPPLDLVEMGLSEDLITTVVKNEPCPSLQPPLAGEDPGRLILTTVNHLNPDVWELAAEPIRGPPGAAESPRTLRPTGAHKFYSETRGGWAATNELEPGEVIRGRSGPMRVTRAGPLPGVDRVYNLTVEGVHVYYVSELGLLAHNNCLGNKLRKSGNYPDLGTDAHHIVAYSHRSAKPARDIFMKT